MKAINMLRSTAVALLSLSVIIACDNRGVTAMKSRMYTSAERAQARAAVRSKGDSAAAAPGGDVKTTTKVSDAPASTDPKVTPNDGPESKNYFEKTDATNQHAAIQLAKLRKIVEEQLGQVNEAAKARVLGLTITNKSTANASIIDIDAVVFFRGRQQTLNLSNLKIEAAAKDLVHGTSGVTVKNRTAANVDENQVKPITTDELLVASVCLTEGPRCGRAYLIMQFGRDDKSVDAAVFELDQDMMIQNSNLPMPVTSFEDALNAEVSTSGGTKLRTRADRLERLCKLRPNAPKCLAFRAENASSQASISTLETPLPATFQRAQTAGSSAAAPAVSFRAGNNPWPVTATAPAAAAPAKPTTAPAAAAPAPAAKAPGRNDQLKADAIKKIPTATEVKTVPAPEAKIAENGFTKDLNTGPAPKPEKKISTDSGTGETPWNWKVYNWFFGN